MALSKCHSKTFTVLLVALILMPGCLLPTAKADVRAVNQCSYTLTILWQTSSSGLSQVTLAAGQDAQLGLPSPWAGVVWGSPNANRDNGQCSQLEFSINPSDDPGRDSYDISLVNAYNQPVMINPTYLASGDGRGGLECGTVTCTIPDFSSVCQGDNYYAGPDNACINADGTGVVDTPGIDLFRNACPEAYVQSNDDVNVVYGCTTGSNYDAVWCP